MRPGRRRSRAFRFDPPPGALERLLQTTGFDRLQQVIDGVDLEGFDGVLVEGGHKHHGRSLVFVFEEPAGDLEPPKAGHLNVEEYQIGLVSLDGADGFDAVAGLGDDLDAIQLPELIAQLLARQLLVVHHDHAQGAAHAVICSGATSSGTSMRALVPRPGSLLSVN